jgi:signal transduction histidine kinase
MLRKKLLIRIGLLVAGFVAGAVVAIYLLQSTVPDIDRINADSAVLVNGSQQVADAVAQIESERASSPGVRTAELASAEATLVRALREIEEHPAVAGGGGGGRDVGERSEAAARVRGLVGAFLRADGVEGGEVKRGELRAAIRDMSMEMRSFVLAEQSGFATKLRWLVLGLTLAALVMVNVAVFVLLRTAQVVLKPVGELVKGSRELAAEHFEHRVREDQQDEFGELARAYNRLAEQLQANEERKVEALRQLAVTLNHDLNNAMATIEMQLRLLDRQSGGNQSLARYFKDIQSTLSRMSSTVSSLKQIRRVVLMDYIDGQKMVDLERSVAALPAGMPAGVGRAS